LINENHALPEAAGASLTQNDIARLDDSATEQYAIKGLEKLLSDAKVIH